ncbi:hypothetical protein [Laceyella putida]|uniref:Uncharacterized protein n=1 Tax=Laceyella putida TaxID=110101 RepID=A0ABW2RN60_9BACL
MFIWILISLMEVLGVLNICIKAIKINSLSEASSLNVGTTFNLVTTGRDVEESERLPEPRPGEPRRPEVPRPVRPEPGPVRPEPGTVGPPATPQPGTSLSDSSEASPQAHSPSKPTSSDLPPPSA